MDSEENSFIQIQHAEFRENPKRGKFSGVGMCLCPPVYALDNISQVPVG